jgi:hypothetical protein
LNIRLILVQNFEDTEDAIERIQPTLSEEDTNEIEVVTELPKRQPLRRFTSKKKTIIQYSKCSDQNEDKQQQQQQTETNKSSHNFSLSLKRKSSFNNTTQRPHKVFKEHNDTIVSHSQRRVFGYCSNNNNNNEKIETHLNYDNNDLVNDNNKFDKNESIQQNDDEFEKMDPLTFRKSLLNKQQNISSLIHILSTTEKPNQKTQLETHSSLNTRQQHSQQHSQHSQQQQQQTHNLKSNFWEQFIDSDENETADM